MLAHELGTHTSEVDALQREMDHARTDMAEAMEELKLELRWRLNPRRQLLLHPWASLTVVAAVGLGLTLGVRRFVQIRRIRRTLEQLAAARGRRLWMF